MQCLLFLRWPAFLKAVEICRSYTSGGESEMCKGRVWGWPGGQLWAESGRVTVDLAETHMLAVPSMPRAARRPTTCHCSTVDLAWPPLPGAPIGASVSLHLPDEKQCGPGLPGDVPLG